MDVFDSHGHYFDAKYQQAGEDVDRLLRESVFGDGVRYVVNVATNLENARLCVRQAQAYEGMLVAVGIHPEDCKALEGSPEREIGRLRDFLGDSAQRREKKIVALGEIGLDYYWEPYEKERQKAFFEGQLALARELGMPVMIHDREAHGDCFETVLRYPEVKGVFHSYSGSPEMATELVRRGWYLSFSGVLTFKNAKKVREAARVVPLDRILVETDCPYLTPEPYRGRLNHSGYLIHTLTALAELREIRVDEAAALTCENAKRLFGIE